MVKFLGELKHEKAAETTYYKFENVNFKWQTTKTDLNCGVYTMHHIKHFNGVAYAYLDMTKAAVRRVIKAEICAALVLSKKNDLRNDVFQKVHIFYKSKPEVKTRIVEVKKKETIEKVETLKKKRLKTLKTYRPRTKRVTK